MNKMFYSFADGNLYRLSASMPMATVMKELSTYSGVLIYADDRKLELVEYHDGHEVEFDTRFLIDLDDCPAVIRKKFTVEEGE